jgi:acyl carrier protein
MQSSVSEGTVLPKIERYVRENYLYARPDFVLQPMDSLLQTGIVDSMGVMELVAYIENEFGVALQDTEITEQNLGTLYHITRCVESKLAHAQTV